jgi:2-polyprenyl-6-hydroxyphenyl methylase / 3-demethylubiquinone-9 3-methyltransferase
VGALDTARRWNRGSNRATYLEGDAMNLPFPQQHFDAVSLLDFLEHVTDPEAAVKEAARVLKPGGLLFYHTFNRNPVSWLIAIKGVEWVVPNVPKDMHILRLFIKPKELEGFLNRSGLRVKEVFGTRPVLNRSFWRLLTSGRIEDNFAFKRTSRLTMGYLGFAQK